MLQIIKNSSKYYSPLINNYRYLTSTEVSTALRPFYFTVHPDLFGQYPNERQINENSLKQLSSLIEMLHKKHTIKPTILQFYMKNKSNQQNGTILLRHIKITIKGRNLHEIIHKLLKTCELSTEYIDRIIPKSSSSKKFDFNQINYNYEPPSSPIYEPNIINMKIKKTKDTFTLLNWLMKHHREARELALMNIPLMDEIKRIKNELYNKLKLYEIRWDCGWNITHFKGCLKSFHSLSETHPEFMDILKNRTLVFGPFTGISLDGHIMLNSGEVRHNWLDLIKNVKKYDLHLIRIPNFEKSVRQVLNNIKVGRRKFMPKILAGEYERNLQQITTTLNDYRSRNEFPNEWPKSLENYEIVVETEAGPLMVSPTGQFIVPSSMPGTLLINFITNNLMEAGEKIQNYQKNKHIERSLHDLSRKNLNLAVLRKDDNITPDMMIECCQKLLENNDKLSGLLDGIHLNITTYYSVLSDGLVCIPWNWKL